MRSTILKKLLRHQPGEGPYRVLGNIWCVGAGEPSSRPVRDAQLGESLRLRLTSPSLAWGGSVKLDV